MAVNKQHKFDADLQVLANFHKVLSHPARLAIIDILSKYETAICNEIVAELPLSQSTISQHLKELKALGILISEQDGPRVNYTLNSQKIKEMRKKMNKWNKKIVKTFQS